MDNKHDSKHKITAIILTASSNCSIFQGFLADCLQADYLPKSYSSDNTKKIGKKQCPSKDAVICILIHHLQML